MVLDSHLGALRGRRTASFRLIGAVFAGGALVGAAATSASLRPRAVVPVVENTVAVTRHEQSGREPAGRAYVGFHPAEVIEVVDGDTFLARVHIWPGLDVTTKVRLRGIDAPEMRSRCDGERERALAARDRLASILAQGEVGVSQVGVDKYGGRVLAAASTRGTADVSAALLAAGLARAYSGGRRESWCERT